MINYSDKTLNKKEESIKARYSPIFFVKEIKDTSIGSLAKKFFQEGWDTTSEDKEFCSGHMYRSYYDFYRLCLYYHPDITFKKVYRYLQKSLRGTKYNTFFTCTTIGRAVIPPWSAKNKFNFV
jgi:hypothetical protein